MTDSPSKDLVSRLQAAYDGNHNGINYLTALCGEAAKALTAPTICYSNCEKHQGMRATMKISYSPPKVICPICEPQH